MANDLAEPNQQLSEDSKATDFDRDGAWTKCAEDVWAHEDARVERWSSEIDTLLVFVSR